MEDPSPGTSWPRSRGQPGGSLHPCHRQLDSWFMTQGGLVDLGQVFAVRLPARGGGRDARVGFPGDAARSPPPPERGWRDASPVPKAGSRCVLSSVGRRRRPAGPSFARTCVRRAGWPWREASVPIAVSLLFSPAEKGTQEGKDHTTRFLCVPEAVRGDQYTPRARCRAVDVGSCADNQAPGRFNFFLRGGNLALSPTQEHALHDLTMHSSSDAQNTLNTGHTRPDLPTHCCVFA